MTKTSLAAGVESVGVLVEAEVEASRNIEALELDQS